MNSILIWNGNTLIRKASNYLFYSSVFLTFIIELRLKFRPSSEVNDIKNYLLFITLFASLPYLYYIFFKEKSKNIDKKHSNILFLLKLSVVPALLLIAVSIIMRFLNFSNYIMVEIEYISILILFIHSGVYSQYSMRTEFPF